MDLQKPRQLIDIASTYTSLHVVAVPPDAEEKKGSPPHIVLFMAGTEHCTPEILGVIKQHMASSKTHKVIAYDAPVKRVPGTAPESIAPNGILYLYKSKEKPSAVPEEIGTFLKKLATVSDDPGIQADFAKYGSDAFIALVKEKIGEFYRGLDGGIGVREPATTPPRPGPASHAAAVPAPEAKWTDPKPAGQTAVAALATATITHPPTQIRK